MIRELNKELGFNVGVLADLQGPKLRVGKMKDDVVVEKGARIVFTTKKIEEGTNALVYMNYQSFPKDVKVGEQILLDDGKLIFEVASTDGQSEVVASVVQGGPLNSNKGVNLPNTEVSLPALTEKDVKDTMFAIEQQVDWFALSFVRNKEDLLALKNSLKKYSSFDIPIISKIEKPQALENIDEIIDHSNGLMVARGDLELRFLRKAIPLIQKTWFLKPKQLVFCYNRYTDDGVDDRRSYAIPSRSQ